MVAKPRHHMAKGIETPEECWVIQGSDDDRPEGRFLRCLLGTARVLLGHSA